LLGAVIAIIVGAGVIVGAASLWFRNAVYIDRSLPAHQIDVVIPSGSSFGQVVDVLEHDGVLAHPLAFRLLARLRHVDAEVKAGEYRFRPTSRATRSWAASYAVKSSRSG
jgi:cell division protein YceG involved in septum cleavage